MAIREVIFRGKRTDNGEWVYGYYTKARYFLNKKEMHIIFEPDVEAFPHCEFTGYEEVLSETVGQYTGLTDKNGVRIFEGDILKSTIKIIDCDDEEFSISPYDREDIGIVEWRKDGFMIAHKSGTWARSFYGCENYVIGNIHDNPKILKGGGDNG